RRPRMTRVPKGHFTQPGKWESRGPTRVLATLDPRFQLWILAFAQKALTWGVFVFLAGRPSPRYAARMHISRRLRRKLRAHEGLQCPGEKCLGASASTPDVAHPSRFARHLLPLSL